MQRTYKMIRIKTLKMKHPVLKEVTVTRVRKNLVNYILQEFPYWKRGIPYMSNDFLLMQCTFDKRNLFIKLFINELKTKQHDGSGFNRKKRRNTKSKK